jgi:penicillin amidase
MHNPARWMALLALVAGTNLLAFLPRAGTSATRAAAGAGQARASLEAAARTAPSDTEGTKELPRLKQQVTVIRDSWGVPHIYAQNQHDMFFAQGFVSAQDRLFQMALWKRAGRGTLAEVLCPRFLDRDIGARLLRYRGDMDAEYASYAPEGEQILEAFTEGINAYIKTRMALVADLVGSTRART